MCWPFPRALSEPRVRPTLLSARFHSLGSYARPGMKDAVPAGVSGQNIHELGAGS